MYPFFSLFFKDEHCESARVGTSGSRLTFSYSDFGSDPCQGYSVTRCPSIYFRLVGVDSGGTRCLTEEKLPCRTATAAQITLTHLGMKCGAPEAMAVNSLVLLMSIMVGASGKWLL